MLAWSKSITNSLKFQFPEEIEKIEKTIEVARGHIAATELEEARQQLDKVAREIDQLYDVMEAGNRST